MRGKGFISVKGPRTQRGVWSLALSPSESRVSSSLLGPLPTFRLDCGGYVVLTHLQRRSKGQPRCSADKVAVDYKPSPSKLPPLPRLLSLQVDRRGRGARLLPRLPPLPPPLLARARRALLAVMSRRPHTCPTRQAGSRFPSRPTCLSRTRFSKSISVLTINGIEGFDGGTVSLRA